MLRNALLSALAMLAISGRAAERRFDFSAMPVNQPPPGCESIVAGGGKPGDWKVITDEVPVATGFESLTGQAPTISKNEVVAQLSKDITDEHFPILLLGKETYGDFKLTTRFKIVSGVMEQMAGLAFRVQDEKNFYVLRASALGKNFRFYPVVNGERRVIIGPDSGVPVSAGEWHEMSVECRGNQIYCLLDGKAIIPPLSDNSLAGGRIGFWTKSDSVSYFADTRITYTPREPFVQTLVRDTLTKYPRLLGLQVVMLTGTPPEPRLVASDKQQEVGSPGRKSAVEVIQKGTVFYDKDGDHVTVTMPLRDRNGDAQAAVRVTMSSFKGQTEENAIMRAVPIVKEMQERVPAAKEWNE